MDHCSMTFFYACHDDLAKKKNETEHSLKVHLATLPSAALSRKGHVTILAFTPGAQ